MIFTPFSITQKDTGGLDFSSIFTKSSSQMSKFKEQLKIDVQSLNNYKQAIATTTDKTEAWTSTMANASKSAKNIADDFVTGKETAESFATSQMAASKALNATSASSKMAAIGVKALDVALNVGTILAVTAGIQLLATAVDNYIHKVEKQKESLDNAKQAYSEAKTNVDNTNTKLSDTNKQITELKAKGSLTFVEQAQLDNLEKTKSDLQETLELEKLVAQEKNKAKTDTAIKTLNTYGSRDRYLSGDSVGKEIPWYDMGSRSSYAPDGTQIINSDNKESKNIDNLIQKYKELSKGTDAQKKQAETLKASLTSLAKEYKDTADSITPYNGETASAKQNAENVVKSILKVTDTEQYAKIETDKFNSVWKNNNYKDTVNDLSNLAVKGKLTADTLADPKYAGFVSAMKSAGFSVKDIVDQINALNNVSSKTPTSLSDISTQLTGFDGTISSITDEIKNLGTSFKDLDNAISSVSSGQALSGEQMITLLNEYPELAGAVQETSNGYTIEINVLKQLRKEKIQQSIDSIQGEINDAKQTLNSTAERLQAYSTEIAGIHSLAEAKAALNDSSLSNSKKQGIQTYINYHEALDKVNKDQTKLKALQTELTIVTQPNFTSAVKSGTSATKQATDATKQATDATKQATDAINKEKDALENQKKALEDSKNAMQAAQTSINNLLSKSEEMIKKEYEDRKQVLSDLNDQLEKNAKTQEDANDNALKSLKDQIQAEKDLIEQQKDAEDHNEEQAEKEKSLSKLNAQMSLSKLDNSDSGKKKQAELQDEIDKQKKELKDFQKDYSTKTRKKGLEDLQTQYEKQYEAKNKEIEKELTLDKNKNQKEIDYIEKYTSKEVNIRTEALNLINSKGQDLYNRLIAYNRIYGDGVDATIDKIWNDGYAAIEKYASGNLDVLGVLNNIINQSSVLNGQIDALNTKIQAATEQANALKDSVGGANTNAGDLAGNMGVVADDAERAADDAERAAEAAEQLRKFLSEKQAFDYAIEHMNDTFLEKKLHQVHQNLGEPDPNPTDIFQNTIKHFFHNGTPSVDKKFGTDSFDDLYWKIKNGRKLADTDVPSVLQQDEAVISNDDKPKWVNAFNELNQGLNNSDDAVLNTQDNLIGSMYDNLSDLADDCYAYGRAYNTNTSEGIDSNKDGTVLKSQKNLIDSMKEHIFGFVNSGVVYGTESNKKLSNGISDSSQLPNISQKKMIDDLSKTSEQYVDKNQTYGKSSDVNLGSGINSYAHVPLKSTTDLTGNLQNSFQSFASGCIDYGKGSVTELSNGIKDSDTQDKLDQNVKDLVDKVVKQFKDGFGIHSPSTVMYSIGTNLMQGLINGMSDNDINEFMSSQITGAINGATSSGISAFTSGVAQWKEIASMALAMTGHYSEHNLALLLAQMNTESGGNPLSVNDWDINAVNGTPSKGLMQVIEPTFKAYALPGFDKDLLDPLSNILAAIRYTWARYGGADGVWGQGHGYASGTRNSLGGLANVDEEGYELKMSPLNAGKYAMLQENSQIFTSKMTDVLWGFSKNPMEFIKQQLDDQYSRNSNINVTNQNRNQKIKLEMPIVVNGTADESILNGLKSERNNIVNKVFDTLNKMNVGSGNSFGIV